jgi:hypothetical protein
MKTVYRVEHADCSAGFSVEFLGVFENIDKARAFRDNYVQTYLEEINEYDPEMVAEFTDHTSGKLIHEETWIMTKEQLAGDEPVTRGDRDYISLIECELQ